MSWIRAFPYLRPSEQSTPKKKSSERWWYHTSRSMLWRTDLPLLQRASKPCQQIAASLCVPTMPLSLCLHSVIHERKLMVRPYWLLQIHKLLFFLNLDEICREVRDTGWRNQAPKTRDRCLNPWFTSDELQSGHVDFEVIHYICISSVGGGFSSMMCMTLLNPDRW